MASITEIATQINESKQPITLIYAFNSTGKTKLSVEYKNLTKKEGGKHSGVYYNAYSEDLFRWDKDGKWQSRDKKTSSELFVRSRRSLSGKGYYK